MNERTQLNTELLSADARGRKHIPVAVFAVILIHIVLFLVLLIAAGCRSSARAKRMNKPLPETVELSVAPAATESTPVAVGSAPIETTPVAMAQPLVSEPVTVAEPPVHEAQQQQVAPAPRQVTQKQQTVRPRAAKNTAKPTATVAAKIYVVKSGDTLEKIAKRHGLTIQAVRSANKIKSDLIHPGQKLHLMPDGSAPLQVRSEQKKGAKEA